MLSPHNPFKDISTLADPEVRLAQVRRAFDEEEKNILVRVLEEGNRDGSFHVSHVPFTAEIIHYAVKGLEVPYIYDRLGEGLDEEQSRAVVVELVRRFLGIKTNLSTN